MRKILTIPTLSASLLLQGTLACAESDVGAFQSTVTIQGNIGQSSSGANNRQDLNVGSASNSRTRSFNANVSTGAIRQSAQGSGIQQRINVGSMQNSQASTFSATVQTRSIEQVATKSGQRQELDIGSVTNSTINGAANTSVHVGQDIRQIGSGEIVLGSVKNSTIGNFNQNLTVQGKLIGNNIRMGSVIGQERYDNNREQRQADQESTIENNKTISLSPKQAHITYKNDKKNLSKLSYPEHKIAAQDHSPSKASFFESNHKAPTIHANKNQDVDLILLEEINKKIRDASATDLLLEKSISEAVSALIFPLTYFFTQIKNNTYFGKKDYNSLEGILVKQLAKANISLEEFKYFHYNRNELQPKNINYSNVLDGKFFEKLPPEKSIYHSIGSKNFENEKFVSADGHFEYVFQKPSNQESIPIETRPLSNPVNMGTYNTFSPNEPAAIGHMVFDVLPWILYGNSIKDTTTFEWRRSLNNAATIKEITKILPPDSLEIAQTITQATESEINLLRTNCKCDYK